MSPARKQTLVFAAVIGLATALWLGAVAITGLALGRPSPPRALAWTGSDPRPADDRALAELLVLEADAAWSITQRQSEDGDLDVARLDLPLGEARRDWPLPASCRADEGYVHVRGLSHDPATGDLWLAIGADMSDDWLCAVHLRAGGGLVDLGRTAVAGRDLLGLARDGEAVEALTERCERVRFRPGQAPERARIPRCPEPEGLRVELVGARREAEGWRVTWDARDGRERVRKTAGPTGPPEVAPIPTTPERATADRVPDGALGYGHGLGTFNYPRPGRPADLPAEMSAHYASDVVRADAAGLRRAVTYGGFWHWCLERPEAGAGGIVCIEHDPLDHVATWTSGGVARDDVVTVQWDPAGPILLPASAGGAWLLDRSHTALDGRVYLRLDPTTLERLDPMGVGERLDRVQPRTYAELEALMATGGPHGASLPSDPDAVPGTLFWATIALPLGLLGFPILLVVGLVIQAARRRRPRVVSLPVTLGAGLYLLFALFEGGRFVKLISWL